MLMVSRGLAARGHDVFVGLVGPSIDRHWEKELPGLMIGPLPSTWAAARRHPVATWRFLRALLRSSRPDVALVTEPGGAVLVRAASLATRLPRPKIVSWFHGDVRRMSYSRGSVWCDGHLAISHGIAAQLTEISRGNTPVSVVLNPIAEPEQLVTRPERGAPCVFLYIGRIEHQKRVDRLLRILARVKAHEWRLDVVGDGSLRATMEALACELGIGDRVVWHGWVPRPWSVVSVATALLMTSDSEGLPIVLLEAAARGVPLVSVDCPFGPSEIVVPGRNGWLVPLGSDECFASILARLCTGGQIAPEPAIVRETTSRYRLETVLDAIETGLIRIVAGVPADPTGSA